MATHEDTNETYNILLLGETGVGKSTFINSFANYQNFPNMEDASNLIELIPASFGVTDENNETQLVNIGNPDENRKVDGQSDTEDCKAYEFQSNGKTIKLIDTPGIGDTGGLQRDRENSQKILSFVSHYAILHGILILLKPNHARLDNMFRFCVTELLCYLHKSASDNIVFVFTNARGTSFKPGETITPLKILLKEIHDRNPEIEIPLNANRTYCVDNEGLRYVAALKCGVKFQEDEIDDFSRSWKKSSKRCDELIKYIIKLEPHNVIDSISVNEARRMILLFSKPLADITKNIQINISLVEEQEKKIQLAGEDGEELEEEFFVPKVELITTRLEKPVTVCTSNKCLTVVTTDGIEQFQYNQKCHNPCALQNITADLINNEDLRKCSIMVNHGSYCYKCGCGWEKHMHIYHDIRQSLKNVREESIDFGGNGNKSKSMIVRLRKEIKELEAEQKEITKVSARFAHFLKKTAMTAYNDAVEDYLDHLIEGEKTKTNEVGKRNQVMSRLEEMKRDYKAEKEIWDQSLGSYNEYTGKTIKPKEIYEYSQELYNLPKYGPTIRKMVSEFEDASIEEHENFTEKPKGVVDKILKSGVFQ